MPTRKRPAELPAELRDFHDQKDLVHVFYLWLGMMDRRRKLRSEDPLNFQAHFFKPRTQMCDWMSFHVLFMSMMDFLHANGWELRPISAESKASLPRNIDRLKNLETAWMGLVGGGPMPLREELIREYMEPWLSWLPFMPPDVQAAWAKLNEEKKEPAS